MQIFNELQPVTAVNVVHINWKWSRVGAWIYALYTQGPIVFTQCIRKAGGVNAYAYEYAEPVGRLYAYAYAYAPKIRKNAREKTFTA